MVPSPKNGCGFSKTTPKTALSITSVKPIGQIFHFCQILSCANIKKNTWPVFAFLFWNNLIYLKSKKMRVSSKKSNLIFFDVLQYFLAFIFLLGIEIGYFTNKFDEKDFTFWLYGFSMVGILQSSNLKT